MWRARRLMLYRGIAAFDAVLGVAAFVLAHRIAPHVRRLAEPGAAIVLEPLREYAWLAMLLAPGWPIALALCRLQGPLRERPSLQIVGGVLKAGALITGGVALMLYALKTPYSRILVFSATGLGTLLVLAEKLILQKVFAALHRRGYNGRDVLIIGSRSRARDVVEQVQRTDGFAVRILGCLDTDPARVGAEVLGVRVLGTVKDHRSHIYDSNVDEVVIAMPLDYIPNLSAILEFCEEIGITVRIVPDYHLWHYRPRWSRATSSFEEFSGIPMFTFSTTPTRVRDLAIKRAFDIATAGLGLVLLVPIFTLIAIAIKLLSVGPVFYRTRACGLNGKEFVEYKFRTMVADADMRKAELLRYNEMRGPVFKMTGDPRVTPLGRMLRKYSLDELPQLWNVLKGDMSLVGPRPPLKSELARYEYWQRRRLSVKPGITCLWQVNGRNAVSDFNEWVRLDVEYIDNWSLGLDLKILMETIPAVVRGTGK